MGYAITFGEVNCGTINTLIGTSVDEVKEAARFFVTTNPDDLESFIEMIESWNGEELLEFEKEVGPSVFFFSAYNESLDDELCNLNNDSSWLLWEF